MPSSLPRTRNRATPTLPLSDPVDRELVEDALRRATDNTPTPDRLYFFNTLLR